MQLSPLSVDLFSASVPPVSGGASLDPSAAPFAQWLSSQTKSAPALADPSAPAPFSQFPLNWGFPIASPALTELPVTGADADLLLTAAVPVEALPIQTAAALPKPATAPMVALAEGATTLPAESNSQSLQPTLPKLEGPGVVLRQTSAAQAMAAAKDQPVAPALAEELPVTESLSVPAEANAALPGKPRRAIPSVDAVPPELTTAASSEPQLDPSASVPQAVAPSVIPAEPTLVPGSLAPLRTAGLAAEPGLPLAFAAPTPQLGFSTPVQSGPERAAQMPQENLVPAVEDVVPQPVVTPAVKPAQPVAEAASAPIARPTQAAMANPQGQPQAVAQGAGIALEPSLVAPAAQSTSTGSKPILTAGPTQAAIPNPQGQAAGVALNPSITPDPLLAAEVTQPAMAPSPPVLTAQPSPSATLNPQGLPWQGAQAAVQSAQPTLGRAVIKPVQAAVVEGAGPAVVPVLPERSAVAAMVTGAAPQVLAAGASVLVGLVPPTAVGNLPVGPRQSTGSRPSPLWATATSLEAGAAEGLSPAPVSELNLTAPRPVDAVAAGQQSRNSSLSDQRFADLFAAPAPPAQAVPPQSTRFATAAGFQAAIQLTSDTLQPSSQLEGASTAVVTPLGLPAAPLVSTSSAAPVLTLPSGLQVPEQEVLQQIFGQLPARILSGPQRLTLRLNPEELGEVRLELIVDKETVRAHLLAQSQQVQEVLEKHLPRLREAFEQQGLKLQELQVSVDSGRDGGRSFFGQSQHKQQTPSFAGSGSRRSNLGGTVTEPVVPPPAGPRTSGGLSLRV